MHALRKYCRSWRQVLILLPIFLLMINPILPATPVQAAAPMQPTVQERVPRFESGACNFEVQTTLVEGQDLECGTLIVPEQHANPQGPTMRLSVAIIKSKAANPAPDPIVMLQGGPGGSTIDTYLQMIPLSPNLQGINRDIVLFDQRGTLYAKPSLFCQAYFDEGVRQLNEDISDEEANKRAQAALKECYDQFTRDGVNLSAIDSFENAADVEALRQAMGWEQINLYGVSYGTLLALHVMREYPEGLRSVILDSVVPPQTNFIPNAPQSQNRALEAVFTACEQDAVCSSAYPALKKVFYETVDRLNSDKAQIRLNDSKTMQSYPALMDGDTFIGAVIQMLYVTEFIPFIPQVIYDVHNGNYAFIERVLSLVVFDRTLSLGMYFSVLCAEDADFQPEESNLEGLPEQLAEMEREGAPQFLETCSFWKVDPLPAPVDEPVSSDVPTLVLTGAFDPITPPAFAEEAAKTLSNSYYFVFPVGGHGELASGDCQDQIFLDFVNNPDQKPDGACIADQKLIFTTPGSIVRLPKLISILNFEGTTGWELGLYGLALLFLLTALLVYPIAWLVNLFRGPATPVVPAAPVAQAEANPTWQSGSVQPAAATPARRPLLYQLGPWLAGFAAILLLVFIVVVAVTAVQMALENDTTVLLGLPGSIRPLFLLPLVVLILAVLMIAAAVLAWLRRAGSVGGRVYFSLLTAATWACVAVLAVWGMLTAFFA